MKHNNDEAKPSCHQCGSTDLLIAQAYSTFKRVTSDCKPWRSGGFLARCGACGLVQTLVTEPWQAETRTIYADYEIYHQSGGIEQSVFSGTSDVGLPRSEAIINALRREVGVPKVGKWLDIGCGNGALLRTLSRTLPGWSLFGVEVSDKYRGVVESIPGVKKLHTGDVEKIPDSFDIISLNHVIEHIPGPQRFLKSLLNKLHHYGLVVLEVPDCSQNCFMLLVADHCSHFSTGMLGHVTAAAGYEVLHATNSWVSKEITVIARKSRHSLACKPMRHLMSESEQVWRGWEDLQRIVTQLESFARARQFGIFGTAIAATWLDTQSGRAAEFFVDEDRVRIGKQHLGRPIIRPSEIPDGATVYVALPPVLARRVANRLQTAKSAVHFVCP